MQLIAEVVRRLQPRPRHERAGDRRHLRRVESRRAEVVPGRDHGRRARHRATPTPAQPLVDVILDEAQQKGTGKWMSQNSFDVGAPIPTINAAVESRLISALKSRTRRSQPRPRRAVPGVRRRSREADRCRAAGAVRKQDHVVRAGHGAAADGVGRVRLRHRPGEVARIWRAGCIIRATLLERHPRRLRARSATGEPAAGRAFSDAVGARSRPGARSCRWRWASASRSPRRRVTGVLRRLPQRAPARQSHPGPARLLRRAHIPARRSRRRVPHAVGRRKSWADANWYRFAERGTESRECRTRRAGSPIPARRPTEINAP